MSRKVLRCFFLALPAIILFGCKTVQSDEKGFHSWQVVDSVDAKDYLLLGDSQPAGYLGMRRLSSSAAAVAGHGSELRYRVLDHSMLLSINGIVVELQGDMLAGSVPVIVANSKSNELILSKGRDAYYFSLDIGSADGELRTLPLMIAMLYKQ